MALELAGKAEGCGEKADMVVIAIDDLEAGQRPVEGEQAPKKGVRCRFAYLLSRSQALKTPKLPIVGLLKAALIFAAFSLTIAGYVMFNVGASRTVEDFSSMETAVKVSEGNKHLIRAYNGCRWAVLATGLVALLAFPVIIIGATLAQRVFKTNWGKTEKTAMKRKMVLARVALMILAFLCTIAMVAAVIAIGANVKASDKVSELKSRIVAGRSMLDIASSTLTQLQESAASSDTGLAGIFSSIMSSFSGSDGAGANAMAELATSADLPTLFGLIAPMTVGNLVSAINTSPQGLLQLVAFLSSKFASPSAGGLTCGNGCLNQGDACICTVEQLPQLLNLQDTANNNSQLSLKGACLFAAGCGLLLLIATHEAASHHFKQKLLFTDAYSRIVAIKRAILASSNISLVAISSDEVEKASHSTEIPIFVQSRESCQQP